MDQPTSAPATVYLTQPKLLGELFQDAWKIFRKHWKNIVLLTLAITLPLNLLSAILSTMSPESASGVFSAGYVLSAGVGIILLVLVGFLVPLGIVAIVQADAKNQTLDVHGALKAATSRWAAGVSTSVLMGILLLGLTILLVVPAIYFGIFWSFALYAVMHDKLQGKAALNESKRVVTGFWWKVLGNLFVFSLVTSIIGGIISGLFSVLPDGIVESTVKACISSAIGSFAYVAGYLLYRNLKAVHDPKTESAA
ncbi:MAG: hypothetical protein AAB515_02085 [Patescibacteria group bacterium]